MSHQPRILLIVLWILTFVMISGSYYFQWIEHLEPCLLCIMQRFCVLVLLGILSASLILTTLRWQIFLAFLESLVALCGLYFAMRQIWLQALPQDPRRAATAQRLPPPPALSLNPHGYLGRMMPGLAVARGAKVAFLSHTA